MRHFDNLEAIAVSNELEIRYWGYICKGEEVVKDLRIQELERRYEALVGEKYIYQDTRGIYSD